MKKALLFGSIGVLTETSELQRKAYNEAFKLNNLEYQKKMLNTLSYKKTLERGYSVIRSKDKIISSISNLDEEHDLTVEFKDGKYILRK